MALEVAQYCSTTLSALVANRIYGNAVTVDGILWPRIVAMMMMWVLIVTDVRDDCNDRYWTGNFIDLKVLM
jgi:hypothetical protein